MKRNLGFSLIELIVVIGILAALSVGSLGFYRNYSKDVQLETAAGSIVSDLKSTQSKSINGEDDLKWGIRFINGANDYYEVFSTATDYAGGSVKATAYLPGGITFTDPAESNTKDIIYAKIYGTVSGDTSVRITSGGAEKIINVTALGNIY